MHPEALDGFKTAATAAGIHLDGQFTVLDLGGQDVNGTVHAVFPYADWTTLDIENGVGVDIVADARTWNPIALFDVVIATEVFEHVEDWRAIIHTAKRSLDPGGMGLFLTTCASDGRPVHGATGAPLPAEGEWYGNVNADVLEAELCDEFHEADVVYRYPPGDAYGWARGPRR
jgi:SAM-dependent methyltransferase